LLSPEKIEQEQVEDLQKAHWAVERIVPGIEIVRYLLRVSARRSRSSRSVAERAPRHPHLQAGRDATMRWETDDREMRLIEAALGFAAWAGSGMAPDAPSTVQRLPADLLETATVVVSGTYARGRGPCERLPDGSRRWRLLEGFTIARVHRGDVRAEYVGLETTAPIHGRKTRPLVAGREYLVVLRPSERSLERLARREPAVGPHDVLSPDEVLAIVEP
jgi:hypothetical protein